MQMPPAPYIDKEGTPISVGLNAIIPAMPSWLLADLPTDDVIALRQLEGTVMSIVEIDKYGYVWFGTNGKDSRWFCLRQEEVILQDATDACL